jgi:hypothetical protein
MGFALAALFAVLLVPSGLLRLDPPILGFGTLQVFLSLIFLAGFFLCALLAVTRLGPSFTRVDWLMWGGAFFFVVIILIQVAFRPSPLGFGFAVGLTTLFFGVAVAQTFRLTNSQTVERLIVAAVFLIATVNFFAQAYAISGVDVRLTYSLAILTPVLVRIGWQREAILSPAYFLMWGILLFQPGKACEPPR